MAKTVRVPDKVFEQAKDIAKREGIPIWKAVVKITCKSPEITQESPTLGDLRSLIDNLRSLQEEISKLPEVIQRTLQDNLKVISDKIDRLSEVTSNMSVRVTSRSPIDDTELFDYLIAIVNDLYEKYGKKEFTEEDFDKIREQLLQDRGINIKIQDIIDMLVSEGILKKVKKKYILVQ